MLGSTFSRRVLQQVTFGFNVASTQSAVSRQHAVCGAASWVSNFRMPTVPAAAFCTDTSVTRSKAATSPSQQSSLLPDMSKLPTDLKRMSNTLAAPAARKDGSVAERIAKYLSRRGLGSRRDCETYVTAGRVQINGEAVRSPAFNVPEGAVVHLDGKKLPQVVPPARVFLAHKLKGEIVSAKDPAGRPSVQARLRSMGVPPNLHPVGRLDFNTEGLLLLTDDGDFSRFLEHPAAGLTRVYRVRVWHGGPEQGGAKRVDKMVSALRRGISAHGVQYAPVSAAVLTHNGAHTWLRMTLSEGKRNEIKNLTRVFGCVVVQMHRLEYGPFALGALKAGDVLEVKPPVQLLQMAYNFKHNFSAFKAAMQRSGSMAASAGAARRRRLMGSKRQLRATAITEETAPAMGKGPNRRRKDRKQQQRASSGFKPRVPRRA